MKHKTNCLIYPLLFMGVFLVFTSSCKKDDDNNNGKQNIPVLSYTEVSEITQTTATSGGNITDDGGATVTARGVCWSSTEDPTINDNKTDDGTGVGSFVSSITGLEPNTTNYVRAYATNSAGTGYGSAMSFTTLEGVIGSTFKDPRDGKVYQAVTIGRQEWMAENLAYAPSSGDYWAYNNNSSNVATYGYLYDWQTALNVCPTGWHLPSNAEWSELIDYLGVNAGGKLKATGTIEAGAGLWFEPNTGATNETGFTALPGGDRYVNGPFYYRGNYGYWWSATELTNDVAWYRLIHYDNSGVGKFHYGKEFGFSVRCLRD